MFMLLRRAIHLGFLWGEVNCKCCHLTAAPGSKEAWMNSLHYTVYENQEGETT
jgi:hypothetical protein